MQILGTVLNIFFVIVCILLIILILMQSGRSSGMGLFGGSGSQSAFGAGSADVLTKMTAILVALFMVIGLGMAFLKSKENSMQKIQEKFTEKPGLEDSMNTPETGKAAEGNVTAPADTAVTPAQEAPVDKAPAK